MENALALPSAPFFLDGRVSEGLLWEDERQDFVVEGLPILRSIPPQGGLQVDWDTLRSQAALAGDGVEILETPAIYGGYLIRHFGHFIHESLSRLWWLAQVEATEGAARDACRRLQELEADVVFFMPTWLDNGKDLLPYMREILCLLGLPASRIRILQNPLRFRQLLIPACVWGFSSDQQTLDRSLGCDGRALLRQLFTSAAGPVPGVESEALGRLYVTRSSLPPGLGRLIGDVVLDDCLETAGFSVFQPERCSIAEQIHRYGSARELIFMDGSALYVLWFTRLRPGTRVRVILRRRQGRWMSKKVRELQPDATQIDWQVVDGLREEALTSEKDWESSNVADLAAILRELGIAPPAALSAGGEAALAAHAQALVETSSPGQLARVLQALIAALATESPPLPSRRQRLKGRLRRLLARWRNQPDR